MCRVPAAVCGAVWRRVALCAVCRPPCAPPWGGAALWDCLATVPRLPRDYS
eukprot:gene10041-biopygen2552